MSTQSFDNWIPVEYAADAVQRPDVLSAVLSTVTPIPMNSESKVYPRSGAATVVTTAKGVAFTEDAGTNDKVTLTAVKFALAFRVANEDIDDSLADIINIKQAEFARSYAKVLDNASLGTTAAGNGTTVPFTSLYKALKTTDSNTSYTANDNYTASATSGGITYDDLSNLLSKVENSDWYESGSHVVIAHPSLKKVLRGIKDDQHRPIFVLGTAGTPDTVFDLPIKWSLGAKTSATAVAAPSGNALVFVVNPSYLMLGVRDGVQAAVDKSTSLLTDETILAMRARNAFVTAVPNAHAVLEALS